MSAILFYFFESGTCSPLLSCPQRTERNTSCYPVATLLVLYCMLTAALQSHSVALGRLSFIERVMSGPFFFFLRATDVFHVSLVAALFPLFVFLNFDALTVSCVSLFVVSISTYIIKGMESAYGKLMSSNCCEAASLCSRVF